MRIVRGTSLAVCITVYDTDNNLYKLQSDDKLIFGVKGNPENTEYDIKKVLTADNATDDGYLLSLQPEDTTGLAFDKYFYDIGLQTASGDFYMIIECHDFIIARAVTAKETT